MAIPNGSTERVVCPRCRANCFPGSATCWKCGASLPPPEEVASAASGGAPAWPALPSVHAGGGRCPVRATSRLHSAVIPALAVLVVLAGAILLARAWRAHAPPSVEQRTLELNALKDRLMRERNMTAPQAGAAGPDSVEAQAQREIRRLQSQLDQTPYAAPGADVRLRSGSRMSREEYERLRRQTREAPP